MNKINLLTLLLSSCLVGCSPANSLFSAPQNPVVDSNMSGGNEPLINAQSTITDNNYPLPTRIALRKKNETLKFYVPTSTVGLNPPLDELTQNNVQAKTIAYPVKPTTMQTNLVDFITTLVPNGWQVVEDAGVSTKRTPIIKSQNWETAIDTLTLIHPDVLIKKDDFRKVIRISPNENIRSLNTPPKTWQINKELTLRENIEKWSNESGWDLIWKAGDVNFVIDANAKFVGNFEGRNGVLEKLLRGTHTRATPIKPEWKYGNNVVLIVPKLATNYK